MRRGRGSRPAHRSCQRRARRLASRKLNRLIAWCCCVLRQLVACTLACLSAWSAWLFESRSQGPHETILPVPVAKPNSRPCLPEMPSVELALLSQEHVILRVAHALCAWADQVHVPTHVCKDLEGQFQELLALPEPNPSSACVLRCCLACVVACGDPSLAKVLSRQLGLVTRAMVDWMLPRDRKTKKQTSLEFDRLLRMTGCVRMLLHTRWQAMAGCRRKSWAKQRLQCVHPDLMAALFQPGPLSVSSVRSCVAFLSMQITCKSGLGHDKGCLYVLSSLRECYLGCASSDRRAWRCSMSAPMPRFYEHLRDILLARRNASDAKHVRKSQVFKSMHLGDLSVWVVAVADLHVVRALEHCHLRVGWWPANSQSTKAPAQKPTRRSKASRKPNRRPPPRFQRVRDIGEQALKHLPVVCAKTDRVAKAAAGCQGLRLDTKYVIPQGL